MVSAKTGSVRAIDLWLWDLLSYCNVLTNFAKAKAIKFGLEPLSQGLASLRVVRGAVRNDWSDQ